ncbi:dihydrofolate reductase [Streptomyces sp. AJS327]|uniref:dihydrofolate reductase family protein n=1 Tax=Streptomyces sp. AJS327 TaxID=2545265 RepID=UPI0015DF55F4|nr:dihydrofolate reductase family protein [Streptomyces sp. AJS327]MBA0050050.1 dihydrofolate reductase [Streptomyces sp. AJS327]
MARLSVTAFVSLDGVVQAPGSPEEDQDGGFTQGGWAMPLFDDQAVAHMAAVFDEATAFLLGRRTYEIFAAHWPRVTDPGDPIATRLNTLPKYVASSAPAELGWAGAATLTGDVPGEVARLKGELDGELQIHGSGVLAQSLMEHGLVDVYRILTFPVILGRGKRLFTHGAAPGALRLTSSVATGTGIVMSRYEATGRPPESGDATSETRG